MLPVLAQASDFPEIPSWVWPPALLIVGLAVLAIWANQKGIWSSGREVTERVASMEKSHAAEIAGKNETIGLLREQLEDANERFEAERAQRIADAQATATLKQAATVARNAMEQVEGLINDPDPYQQRMAPKRRPAKRSDA